MIKFILKNLIFLVLFLFVLIFCCDATSATTWNMDSTQSIQTILNNAQDGDTIILSAGTYYRHDLIINKNLTITGPNFSGMQTAVIDAELQGRIFSISPGVSVTLKNLLIRNGKTSSYDYGGGVSNLGGNLTIISCSVTHNTADFGGGIYNNGIMNIYGSNVNNNTASSGGGILNNGNLTISSYSSWENKFYLVFVNSTVNSNTATGRFYSTETGAGGGIYNKYGNLNITGSNVNSNTARYYGGGIYNIPKVVLEKYDARTSGGIVNIVESMIKSNVAKGNGGGIYCDDGSLTINQSKIEYNEAYDGGGICIIGNSTFFPTSTDVNYPTGGVTLADCSYLKANECNFQYNRVYDRGKSIYSSSDTKNGSGAVPPRIVNFNQFYDPVIGYEVYCVSGTVDARYNYWGYNNDPTTKVHGNVKIIPWLQVFKANPNIIRNGTFPALV